MQNLLRTRYAAHLLYASETDCKKPNVEHELKLEKKQLSDLVAECNEILASIGKLLASYAAKVDPDPEPPVFIEPDIIDKPDSEVIDKPELESE